MSKSFFLIIIFSTTLLANLTDAREKLKQSSLANVNALIILTTQDMLTSGRYRFDDGSELHIVNFPIYYHFNPIFSNINLFINGSAGYSKLDSEVDLGNSYNPKDDTSYETIALRLGGGARYSNPFGLNFLLGFDFIYSRIHNNYKYNSLKSKDDFKELFDDTFANQYSNAYTYEFFWQASYTPIFVGWKPYVILSLNYFDSKQDLSFHELSSFRSTSGGSRLKLGFETPQFIHFFNTGLSSEFYMAANAFTGGVRETLGFDGYGSSAAILHLYLDNGFYGDLDEALYHVPSILNRVDLMVERVVGDGIEGYNIGFGAGFSF